MDDPKQNTEAEAEDGITDRNNDLQGPSNGRTIVKLVETVHPYPEAVETPLMEKKKKLKKKEKKKKKYLLLHANHQVLLRIR